MVIITGYLIFYSFIFHSLSISQMKRDFLQVKTFCKQWLCKRFLKNGLKACLLWKVHLAYPAGLQALHSNT